MLKLDQKGFSLPIALAMAALIGANTYYFMLIQKNTSATNAVTRTDLREDAEKKRLIAALADFKVCTANFGGKDVDSLKNPANLKTVVKEGTTILSSDSTNFEGESGSPSFHNNNTSTPGLNSQTIKVGKIYFHELPDAVAPAPSIPQEVRFSLRVEYDVLANSVTGSLGKKVVVIVPLYVEKDGNNVKRCYARPDNSMTTTGLFQALEASCLPLTEGPLKYGAEGCEHLFKPQICADTGFHFMESVGINSTTNVVEFTCAKFYGNTSSVLVSNCSPGMTAKSVIDSVIQCEHVNPCPNGTSFVKNSGVGWSCIRNCDPNDLWSSTPPNGQSLCYHRVDLCPTGKYAKSVDANGKPDCQPITFKNKSCPANQFATHFDTMSTSTDLLHCQGFTRERRCTANFKFTHLNSLASTTPGCTTYN